MRFIILIITSLALTACGGFYGKKLEQNPNFNKISIDFGNENQEYIKAYLASNEKSGSNYSNFHQESDIYPLFDFRRINSDPQMICIGTLREIADCTGYFKPPYKKMTGVWYVNQYFKAEPWGIVKYFVSGTEYVQLIQYKGKKYETAVISLYDFEKFITSKQKRYKPIKLQPLNIKKHLKELTPKQTS